MNEFDLAFHHYSFVVRKQRLIVLMLLDDPLTAIGRLCDEETTADNSRNFDSLHQYLSHHTYIEYSADDWFDKLLYALPINGMLNAPRQQDNAGTSAPTQIQQQLDEGMTSCARHDERTPLLKSH